MPTNSRLLSSISKLHNNMIFSRTRLPTLQPIFQLQLQQSTPATLQHQTRQNTNLYKKFFKKWTGTADEEHAVHRTERNDTTDPETEATSEGMAERAENEGIADGNKSQATTERGGLKHQRRAKEEFPKAPEPVIGMNDERAEVSFVYLVVLGFGFELTEWVEGSVIRF